MILRVAILVVALLPVRAAAEFHWNPLCDGGSKFKTITLTYDKLRLIVSSSADGECSFRVVASSGRVLAHDTQAAILQPQYVDLDSDGLPELIISADSGGSAGNNNSYIVGQAPHVTAVATITDHCPLQADDDVARVGMVLVTCDLNFGMFDDLCNACSPRPAVYLRYTRGRLQDVSAAFGRKFDQEIGDLQKGLKTEDARAFLAARSPHDRAYSDSWGVRRTALLIVLDYLYSDREQEARRTLEEMWPAWDRHRVWKAILKTRGEGILKQIAK